MSYKPDEPTLVAYLYKELNQVERAKVETYLAGHPEKKKELEEIEAMRKTMGKLQDKEVAEPYFVFDNSKVIVVGNSFWNSGFLRATIGVAASIALLMIIGYLTHFSIGKNDTGVQISFGESKNIFPAQPAFTKEDVKMWMEESLASNSKELLTKINEVKTNFAEEFETQKLKNSQNIQSAMVKNKMDESLIQEYVTQLKQENRTIILTLMKNTDWTQRQYINELVADFSSYLEEQRQQDLDIIHTSFDNLKNNAEVNHIETNQILASLITTVNNQNN